MAVIFTWKLSCFRIGFFLCMAILCISCPLRTFIRKNTRLVPLKVTIIKIRQPWPFWSKSNAIIAIWQNKYVKLSPKVRKVYFYDPGKMPLLRCVVSFKTNSKLFNFSKPILKFPSFQFLIINIEFFQLSNYSKPVLFIFCFQFLCSPVAGHPGTVNMNMNVDPASSNLNIGVDMKSDYKMNSLEVDSSSWKWDLITEQVWLSETLCCISCPILKVQDLN